MHRSCRFSIPLAGLAFLSVMATCYAAEDEVRIPSAAHSRLDRIVDETVARYHLPGIAVGVIEDGKITYAGTRGETIAGSGRPVTRDTVFKIASNSKAMTASMLARLVDAGKLRWEDPVTRYLPQFRMYDPWVTREMQVKDLLVHNSGLPQGGGDLMLWPEPNQFTREDIIAGLAHIKPAYSFRSGYAYDNLLYVVAGEVAASAAGIPYEALVRQEIFQPLSLDGCRVGAWESSANDDVAQPHTQRNGHNATTNLDGKQVPALVSAAAGGIRCSLDDMLAWARNWVAPDKQAMAWLSAEQRRQAWTPRTPMPVSTRRREWDGTRFYAYGYGWRIADVDGAFTVSHTGTLSGMYSVMTLLPNSKSGFVVLINGEAEEARTVLNEVLLKYFTRPGQDKGVSYYASQLEHDAQQEAAKSPAPASADRDQVAASSLTPWLGVYRDPWFGEVRLCTRDTQVSFQSQKSPMLSGRVMSSGGRYLIDWDHDSVDLEAWLDFKQDKASGMRQMSLAKVDPEGDFSFDYEDLAFERVGACD
ncbi:MAG: serine hydrolase [Pseudoxanthomonas sp.]